MTEPAAFPLDRTRYGSLFPCRIGNRLQHVLPRSVILAPSEPQISQPRDKSPGTRTTQTGNVRALNSVSISVPTLKESDHVHHDFLDLPYRPRRRHLRRQAGLFLFRGHLRRDRRLEGRICMHLLTIPPGGRAKAHKHESHETAIYVLSGETHCWDGERLEHHCTVRDGRVVLHPGRGAASARELERQARDGRHRPHRSERAGERRAAAGAGEIRGDSEGGLRRETPLPEF